MNRTAFRPAALALVTLAVVACSGNDVDGPEVPDDWNAVVACADSLSFQLPPDVLAVDPGPPIDSCVGRYVGPGQDTKMDYGVFSSSLVEFTIAPYTDVVEWNETVDGREAHFKTSLGAAGGGLRLVTGVVFDNVHGGTGDGTRLAMWSLGATDADRDDALRIFRTIDFAD